MDTQRAKKDRLGRELGREQKLKTTVKMRNQTKQRKVGFSSRLTAQSPTIQE